MDRPNIATGKHMEGRDPRFRINTHPGPMKGVNQAHGSSLDRKTVIELRDELNAWLDAHPTFEEQVAQITNGSLTAVQVSQIAAAAKSLP